jgi:diguanylate cyclase (GGDEF)-like protein
VRELAFYDALTSLPNRRLFIDRMTQTMLASKRSGCYSALLFLDLDNFKPINDKHGHDVGDLLLIEAANRLKSCVREIDTVARFGGDEYVVLLFELSIDKAASESHARIVSEKILTSLSEPYLFKLSYEGQADAIVKHRCTASIGVVLFINHEASQKTIFKRADSAMYKAKEAVRNQIQFYEEDS